MPKVTVEVGGYKAYCSPSQVFEVGQQLASVTNLACTSGHGLAADAITNFVVETHQAIANSTDATIPDLRQGVNHIRSLVLQKQQPKAERNADLAVLKSLDRLSIASAELRHFSQGHLTQTARTLMALMAKLRAGSNGTITAPIDDSMGSVSSRHEHSPELFDLFGDNDIKPEPAGTRGDLAATVAPQEVEPDREDVVMLMAERLGAKVYS